MKNNGIFIFSTHHPIADFQSSITHNYFEKELLTQNWKISDSKNVEVSFYRKPIGEIFDALFSAGFVMEKFSEGIISKNIKNRSEKTFHKLSTQPQFIFIKARKST